MILLLKETYNVQKVNFDKKNSYKRVEYNIIIFW